MIQVRLKWLFQKQQSHIYATVEVQVLIGMGAIVIDICYIESGSIIAAAAVLLEEEGLQRLKNKR